MANDWIREFPGGITVVDEAGRIIEMNEKAIETFEKYGGRSLIGKKLAEVHPEPARSKVLQMLADKKANSYTIEKNGVKKLIHQTPWYRDGGYAGFVELSLELPDAMPHFVRS